MLDQRAENKPKVADCTPAPSLQRMRGRGFASLRLREGAICLKDLHQSGSAKVFLPKIYAKTPEVVFLNTAGGVTGGDHIRYELDVGAGAAATATTQTAERAYQSTGDVGRVDVAVKVGAGARVDWLPQETILFVPSNMARKTIVELAPDATFAMVETIVLGRAAMGETIHAARFADWREVRRGGAVQWVEPFALSPAVLQGASSSVTLGGARAFATIAFFAAGAVDALSPIRAVLAQFETVKAAASAWEGRVIVRLHSQDAWPLQRAVAQVLERIRTDPLPRVWQK
jgi:urease accessory protein